mgnify:CR=1 FL=1
MVGAKPRSKGCRDPSILARLGWGLALQSQFFAIRTCHFTRTASKGAQHARVLAACLSVVAGADSGTPIV